MNMNINMYCSKERHTYKDVYSNIDVTFEKTDCPYCEIDRLEEECERLKEESAQWEKASLVAIMQERDELRQENERFKVMYKGFENQFYEIQRLRDALLKVANWYEDVHDTADFSGDTPSSYAKEFLVRSGVKV